MVEKILNTFNILLILLLNKQNIISLFPKFDGEFFRFKRIWRVVLVTWCNSNITLWSRDYSSKKCRMNWYLILSFECLENDHITRSDCTSSTNRCNEISVFKKIEGIFDFSILDEWKFS
jgi:hypothetical protein